MADIPKVSVLMTVYNGLSYLPQAIQSVLGQTLSDFELLIVDDASTDGSVACIRSYADPRIRLVCNEENLGQARSLNKGLELCRAPYVARLDQDDLCLPDRLRKQVDVMEKRPDVAVVGTFMVGIDDRGRRIGLLGRRVDNYGVFVSLLLLGICPVCHPSVMFRRHVVSGLAGYDESFSPAEDVDLWVRLALQRYSATVIPEPLALYRIHGQQQSMTKAAIQRLNIRRDQEKIIRLFCPPSESRGVSLLLSGNETFWSRYASKEYHIRTFRTLCRMMENLEDELRMSPHEKIAFERVMNRWLGLGVRIAPRIARWPSWLFYLIVGMLSPLLIPRMRRLLSRLTRPFRRARAFVRARSVWSFERT